MLSLLRQKTIQRGLFIALCILVIPGFVFLSTTTDSSGMNGTAGSIGGRKIKVQEFIRNFEAMRRELEVFGGADLAQMAGSVDFEALAWQRILLVDAAKKTGIKVADAEVISWIQEQPVFLEEGKFSKERYQLVVERYLKMDPKTFEEESREYLVLQRYRDKIRGSYAPAESELQESFKLLYGPRGLEYVIFAKDSVSPPEAASEEELQSMYGRLSGRLLSQESVSVKYLALGAGAAEPGEAEEAGLWQTSAVRTPFFAKEEPITGIGSAPALTEVLFTLKNSGDRTGWLERDGKRYRFELVEHKPQAPMTYDDAKNILTDLVGQEKTFRAVIDKASAFSDEVKKSGWSPALAASKLEPLKTSDYKPGDYIEKVGKLARIGQALSELKAGETSAPLPTSNGLVLFHVTSQAEPDASLFDSKREELERGLRLRHEMEVFGKALQALQNQLTVNTKALARLFPSKYESSPASK
jgi:hypothetical protein